MGNVCSCVRGSEKKSTPSSDKKFSDLKKNENESSKNGHHKVPQSEQKPTQPDTNSHVQQAPQTDNELDTTVKDEPQQEQEQPPQELEQQPQEPLEQPDPNQDEPASPNEVNDENAEASGKPTVTEFGEEGEGQGEFKMAKGIAVFLYGDIAVTEHGLERVYLFGKDGEFKQTVASSHDENREAKLLYPTDLAFTPLGHIAVADQTRFVKIFNLDGDFLHRFNIKGSDEEADVKPKAYSIEVTSDEQILVGDIRRKVITIIKEADAACEWIRKVKLNIEPHFLATNVTNGRHQALACDWKTAEVNAIDLEAEDGTENVNFKLDSFQVDGKPGLPKGLACDDENRIYVAVSSGDGKNVYIGTGHIHRYSCDGEFEKCLTKGLYHPRGLAWHNGSLYVANTHSVVILNTS